MDLDLLTDWFSNRVPHNRELDLRAIAIRPDGVAAELPYSPRLVGNPLTGVLHGGAVTSLIDATAGAAVIVTLRAAYRIATLDLRIDYLKPAAAGRVVVCDATCYRHTRNVAFVRAEAHHGDRGDLIASAAGAFMIFRDEPLGQPERP